MNDVPAVPAVPTEARAADDVTEVEKRSHLLCDNYFCDQIARTQLLEIAQDKPAVCDVAMLAVR